MATLTGYPVSSGARDCRIRIPCFTISGASSTDTITSLSFTLPIHLVTNGTTGTYTFRIALVKEVSSSEWYYYNSGGYKYWGTDNNSNNYWLGTDTYESLIGSSNKIYESTNTFPVTFTSSGASSTQQVKINLTNLSIPMSSLKSGNTFGVAIVRANNSSLRYTGGQSGSGSVTISSSTVTAPSSISSTFSNGTVGTYYSSYVTSNGDTPITWSLYSGTLPPGLSLSAGSNTTYGYLKGTPTTSGTYSFTLKAANSGGSTTKSFSLTINSAASVPTITYYTSNNTSTNVKVNYYNGSNWIPIKTIYYYNGSDWIEVGNN